VGKEREQANRSKEVRKNIMERCGHGERELANRSKEVRKNVMERCGHGERACQQE